MGILDNKAWPPKGLATLGEVRNLSGQTLIKDSQNATIRGLSYAIESEPLYSGSEKLHAHYIQVDGWEYSIHYDSLEFPVLSFNITDRFDEMLPEEYYISNIKAMACPVDLTERTSRKTLELFHYFVRQIERDKVPDIDRIMRIYRLHPVLVQKTDIHGMRDKQSADTKKTLDDHQTLFCD